MAVEKGLYQAPVGLNTNPAEETPELEIEIVNPESVTLDDGSMEITIVPDADTGDTIPFDGNIAEILDDGELNTLANDIIGAVDSDVDSRKDWADTFVKGLDVLGFK